MIILCLYSTSMEVLKITILVFPRFMFNPLSLKDNRKAFKCCHLEISETNRRSFQIRVSRS